MDLPTILAAIETATGISPTAFNTTQINTLPAINFIIYRNRDNGAVATWRLQTRITADNLKEAMELEELVKDTLVTIGDEPKFDCVIEINGGGTLEDEETRKPQILTYFDITTRS